MIEPRPVWDFLDSPCPYERGVILGKGPSLDRYEPDVHGKGAWVLGIAEGAVAHPCHAAIHLETDPLPHLPVSVGAIVFRSPGSVQHHIEGNESAIYVVRHERGADPNDRQVIPRWGGGTTTAGVCIMAIWGIHSILMVGCDSESPHLPNAYAQADCIKDRVRRELQQELAPQLKLNINDSIKDVADKFKLNLTWFHRQAA